MKKPLQLFEFWENSENSNGKIGHIERSWYRRAYSSEVMASILIGA